MLTIFVAMGFSSTVDGADVVDLEVKTVKEKI